MTTTATTTRSSTRVNAAGAPSALVAYGDDDARKLALSPLRGHLVNLNRKGAA